MPLPMEGIACFCVYMLVSVRDKRVGRKREREGANENENICVVKEIF